MPPRAVARRDLMVDACGEVARAVAPAPAEEVVARRGLDEKRHAPPRADRDAHQRQLDLEQGIAAFEEPEAIRSAALPLDQLDDQVDAALVENRERPEQR